MPKKVMVPDPKTTGLGFDTVPPVGTEIVWGRRKMRGWLVAVVPARAADGRYVHHLMWKFEDGRRARSFLNGTRMYWNKTENIAPIDWFESAMMMAEEAGLTVSDLVAISKTSKNHEGLFYAVLRALDKSKWEHDE